MERTTLYGLQNLVCLCFNPKPFYPQPPFMFQQLMQVIEDRKVNPPKRSYTAELFAGGAGKIGNKIIEEAGELAKAARETEQDPTQRSHLIYEACDLIYHLLVLLGHHEVKLSEIESELARRFGTSGLDEKAARTQPPVRDV